MGRKIEAEIVRADADSVTVLRGGREVKISRVKLSEEDQKFCDEWIENGGKVAEENDDSGEAGDEAKPPQVGAAKGEIEFDGKPLVTGGKVNVFSYDYELEELNSAKKNLKDGETGFRIGIAVPAGFDPSKPQRVFIANTAQNNAQQTAQGNTAMAGFLEKQCVEEGWVCFAYESNLGRPNHDQDLVSAVAKMNEVWPQFRQWKFVSGGFSGGGKAAFWPAAYLLKNSYDLTGLFLANTNQDFSGDARTFYKIKKSDYSDVSVFWGTGKWDEIATQKTGEMMKKSLEGNGMKQVRVEFHEGKHSLYHPQFIEALRWFKEQG
jgi:predicted esterase